MATLEDSFLADLDELSDNEAEINENDGKEDINIDMADLDTLNYDDLDSVSKLQKSQRYADIMQKVEEALGKDSDGVEKGTVLEDDPEYKLIVDCNQLSVDIENEIVIVHNFIRDKYRLKFQELESLVHNPIDYARVVKKIGNETDLTLVDLEGLLPSATIMVVSVTALTAKGSPLPEDVLQKTLEACDRALDLDAARKKVLDFVESKMGSIAPNHVSTTSESLSSQNPTVTTCRDGNGNEDPKFRSQQKWLLFLRHARNCRAPRGKCPDRHCVIVQNLWKHMENCAAPQCSYPRCRLSKTLIGHHRYCRESNCPVCIPVRAYLKQRADLQLGG